MKMMKWGMEFISPAYLPNSNWLVEDMRLSNWTLEENKLFENALAVYDKDTSDRWQRVASMIPGKSVLDVVKHYKDLVDDVSGIEAGRIPIPGYITSSFTRTYNAGFYGLKHPSGPGGKVSAARLEQARKKGVAWSEEEHKLFLFGLRKYGKGDWRSISRNIVQSRTPTQVASHAQKYFKRKDSGGKNKRFSIHDINLNDNGEPLSPTQSPIFPMQHRFDCALETQDEFHELNEPSKGANFFRPKVPQTHSSFSMPSYGRTPYGMKLQGHNFS